MIKLMAIDRCVGNDLIKKKRQPLRIFLILFESFPTKFSWETRWRWVEVGPVGPNEVDLTALVSRSSLHY